MNADLAPFRAAAQQGICPLCGAGPWASVAKHVAKKHHVSARELKGRLGIPISHGLNSPDLTEQERAGGKQRGAPPSLISAGLNSHRAAHISGAGKVGRAEGLRRARAVSADSRRKIPLDALPQIKDRVAAGERLRDIGADFGVTAAAVHYALRARP